MRIPILQIDAFATKPFSGNPAAVCPLDEWLDDSLLQAIAAENNLSETAFLVRRDDHYELRWFTPVSEVDLCGHATLAAAHAIFAGPGRSTNQVQFTTRSGRLSVRRDGDLLVMDFPSQPPRACQAPEDLLKGLGAEAENVLCSEDYLVVFRSEEDVRRLEPDLGRFNRLPLRGVIVTSPGTEVDFVSRFFAPKYGIMEDPVTGSAHCALAPYWSGRLGKKRLRALQVSRRGGEVLCEVRGERVLLSGNAVKVMQGELFI